jgi:hypothetical protein
MNCAEKEYEIIDTNTKNESGRQLKFENDGIQMRIPQNYVKLNTEQFLLKLEEQGLDSIYVNYESQKIIDDSGIVEMFFDSTKVTNYMGLLKIDHYMRISSNSIDNFFKGMEKTYEKYKSEFSNLEFKILNKSRIQIDKPYKFYKAIGSLKINDWERMNSIYLKADMIKARTVAIIFVNENKELSFDEYVNTIEFYE